ncbi:hypothetical protein GOB05_33630, partial [Sinorhizobium meliloti]|nr:hypothetical protein [Sinorhizobium meliloti]
RGRLFLGIGGRDHFGIRGRIASEFAPHSRHLQPSYWIVSRITSRPLEDPVEHGCPQAGFGRAVFARQPPAAQRGSAAPGSGAGSSSAGTNDPPCRRGA